MTNLELINLMKQKLIDKNDNPIIANWIFCYINNLNDLNEMVSILYNQETTKDKCIEILNKYLIEEQPLARILGFTYFYKNKFLVHNNVFAPRLETEILVDEVIKLCQSKNNLTILDMCCGTGIIGISIAKNTNNTNQIFAIDISQDAINNTIENSKLLECDIKTIHSNLFTNWNNKLIDVLVCNPPYIGYQENINSNVVKYDPNNALFANNNGYEIYEQIVNELPKIINFNSYLIAFEIGYLQANKVKELLINFDPSIQISVIKDYNKLNRVIIGRKNF